MGMHCASIFPMCFMIPGTRARLTFPVCFPQCFMVLAACPGFWYEDIEGPCSRVSIPPFCGFSMFINFRRLPEQYEDYEEQYPYPPVCPEQDPDFDTPDDLFDVVHPASSPVLEQAKEPDVRDIQAEHPIYQKPIKHATPLRYGCHCAKELQPTDEGPLCYVGAPTKKSRRPPIKKCEDECKETCSRLGAFRSKLNKETKRIQWNAKKRKGLTFPSTPENLSHNQQSDQEIKLVQTRELDEEINLTKQDSSGHTISKAF
eukprot:GHVP01040756.1.p1 GENE.GHVP01040756.1~~GHVP01040756.1.p1  ORF type:complete len:259 (+),score=46.69 GHVP01040756.1:168-944(+)